MQIWIINQDSYPPKYGMGTRHHAISKTLVDQGHQVTIITSNYSHTTYQAIVPSHPGQLATTEWVDGVQYCWVKSSRFTSNGIKRVWGMIVFAWRIWRGKMIPDLPVPDVIIGSSPPIFSTFSAERLAARLKVPFVLEVRDVWPESVIEIGNISPWNPLVLVMSWIEKRLYRRADHIISLLPGVGEHISQRGGREDQITWIPNGIDLDFVPSVSPPPDNNRFTVIYAGTHGFANSLDTVVECARIVQDSVQGSQVRFWFIGDGPCKQDLQQYATSLELKNVQFKDAVPKSEIFRELENADAFVVQLKKCSVFRHGVSMNKLFDYLAVGRPVIFGVEAYNDPIAEADAGISVPPEDPQAMAEAVLELANSPREVRIEMGKRGRESVEAHYDMKKLALKLEDVLIACTHGGPIPKTKQNAA